MTLHWRSQLHTAEIWKTNLNHLKGLCWAKPEGNKTLEKTNCRWVDNIKMHLTEREWEAVDWTRLTHDSGKCQSLVKVKAVGRRNIKHVSMLGSSHQQSADSGHRCGATNSSHSFECNKVLSVIDVVISFVPTKRKTTKWVETRVSVCLSVCVRKLWTVKGIPR